MLKKFVLAFGILALAVASAENYRVTLSQPSTVKGNQLKAGEYRLNLENQKLTMVSGKQSVEVAVKVETMDRLEPMTVVVIGSELLGRLGHASVRYCQRVRMKNLIGLKFSTPFSLGDPARRRVVETIAHGMKLAAKMD